VRGHLNIASLGSNSVCQVAVVVRDLDVTSKKVHVHHNAHKEHPVVHAPIITHLGVLCFFSVNVGERLPKKYAEAFELPVTYPQRTTPTFAIAVRP